MSDNKNSFVRKTNVIQSLDAKKFLESEKGKDKLKIYRKSAIVKSLTSKSS